MAIKKSNRRISVILDYEEWEYLNVHASWDCVSMSRYLENLLRKDMVNDCDYEDNPEYIIKSVQTLLGKLQARSKELTVNTEG